MTDTSNQSTPLTMADVTIVIGWKDPNNGNAWNVFDSANPPDPLPNVYNFYLQVSWPGQAIIEIPAWWTQEQIQNTINSDLAIANSQITALQMVSNLNTAFPTLAANTEAAITSATLTGTVSSTAAASTAG